MKRILMVGAMVISATVANAAEIDFRSFNDFGLVCEDDSNHNQHVIFEVKPSEMMVKMNNDKNQTFQFKITKPLVSWVEAHNEFGHLTNVPFIDLIDFVDYGGRTRTLMFNRESVLAGKYNRPEILYIGKGFHYSCVPVNIERGS